MERKLRSESSVAECEIEAAVESGIWRVDCGLRWSGVEGRGVEQCSGVEWPSGGGWRVKSGMSRVDSAVEDNGEQDNGSISSLCFDSSPRGGVPRYPHKDPASFLGPF